MKHMEPRISLVTLGVIDLPRVRAFYEALGWTAAASSNAQITFFNLGGTGLALFPRPLLAMDAKVDYSQPQAFNGTALAQNVESEARVDEVLQVAVAAGATILKPAEKTFWGGYSGVFADPENNIWEIAHNPGFPLDDDGRITIP